jgi:hypothetical protein
VSLPRERFWDVPVPKIDSPTRQPLVPRPPCVRAASPHHRKLGAGYAALPQMALRRVGCPYRFSPRLRETHPFATAEIRPDSTPTGDYRPSLRSPWPAAVVDGLWLRLRHARVDQDGRFADDVRDWRAILNYEVPLL